MKKVLINFRGGIGDYIMLAPMLENLFKTKQYSLVLVADNNIKKLAEASHYFNQAFYFNYNANILIKLWQLFILFWQLLFFKIDICITPISTFGKTPALISYLSKASTRIGFKQDKYSKVNNYQLNVFATEHDSKQNMKILKTLNIVAKVTNPLITINNHNQQQVNLFLQQHNIECTDKIIAIAPFAIGVKGKNSKEWPWKKYKELIKKIVKKDNAQVIILGTAKELAKVKNDEVITIDKVSLLDKNFSILDTATLLQKASLLICNDSGLMHIVAMFNIPIVSIWLSTNPKRYGYSAKKNVSELCGDVSVNKAWQVSLPYLK